jgi:hypothetical protein
MNDCGKQQTETIVGDDKILQQLIASFFIVSTFP